VRGRRRRSDDPKAAETADTMLKLVELGWGRNDPSWRQFFTSQFIPGGTPEQHEWFNELQRISTSPAHAVRMLRGFEAVDITPPAVPGAVPDAGAARHPRYARCIDNSKRVRWDIDRDVIRGRRLDYSKTFMPVGLSLVGEMDFLSDEDRRLLSQVQGRTYAYLFGLVERFIGAKTMELGRAEAFRDQVAVEALVRMADEELKHQELFRRLEVMMAEDMPAGDVKTADPDAVARVVLGKSTWAVMALTLHIELFTQAHFRASLERDAGLSELWNDVFLFHWREESQHAVLDELELVKEDGRLTPAQRNAAVDGILQAQAKADSAYFCAMTSHGRDDAHASRMEAAVLKAYRWQYIVSGVMEPRFQKTLFSLVDSQQAARIQDAWAPLAYAVPRAPDVPLPISA
jgi:hypothetical protein